MWEHHSSSFFWLSCDYIVTVVGLWREQWQPRWEFHLNCGMCIYKQACTYCFCLFVLLFVRLFWLVVLGRYLVVWLLLTFRSKITYCYFTHPPIFKIIFFFFRDLVKLDRNKGEDWNGSIKSRSCVCQSRRDYSQMIIVTEAGLACWLSS